MRWERVLFLFGLTAALAALSACGSSSSTTVTPTVTISCTPADVTLGQTSQCTASVLNLSSTLVNWSVSPSGTGAITAGGQYTAPTTMPTNNIVTVTATSQVQSTVTATQNLTLIQPTAISAVTCVTPGTSIVSSTVSSGNQLNCTATSSTSAIVPVYWSVASKANAADTVNIGSISSQGVYTAPLVPPAGQLVTITATSQASKTETLPVDVTVVFGNKVISGNYAFSTSGRLPTGAFWARAGTFSAGGGAILGIEDTNQGGSPNTVTTQRSFTGSYSIGPDGRGTIQFCEGTSAACPQGAAATAYFRIAVTSPQYAHLIEFSDPGASSATTIAGGEMLAQDPTVFSAGNGNLSGTYSFDFAGVSNTATAESMIGEFASNGNGTIGAGSTVPPLAPGEVDTNTGGIGLVGPTSLSATPYSINTNGRGTVTLNGLKFSFYPVSASRAKFIQIDPASSILTGDAQLQQTSATCGWALNALIPQSGTSVFQTSGTWTSGASAGYAIADLGSFSPTTDGVTGTIGSASIDENSGGTVSSAVGTLTGTYTLDSCGRGTLTIGAHSYVFYIISASNAMLQETTAANGVVADGLIVPAQTGSFLNTSLTGSYAFRLGGTDAAGTAGQQEDMVGQFTSTGVGSAVAGSLDLNDFGATQTGVAISSGTYLPAGSIRATMALPVATTPAASTRNFVLYMVAPKLFYVLGTDATGIAMGAIGNQF